MKKFLLLLAALTLLLWGCGTDEPPPATTTAPAPTDSAQAPGLYEPGSDLEALTAGAVRVYPLDNTGYFGVLPMGGDLLLFSGGGSTTLTVLTGENLSIAAEAALHCAVYPEEASVQVTENGLGYYDEMDNAVVFLDRNLQEVSRVSMPQDAEGFPALSPDLNTIYYCAGNQIRALDIQSGISRLVKEQSRASQSLTGIYCDGSVLACLTADTDGNYTTVYLSTQTGQTLYSGDQIGQLETWGGSYFADLHSGGIHELVFGLTADQEATLIPRSYQAHVNPALALGGVVTADLTDSGWVLDYYDLASGLRTASVALPITDTVVEPVVDGAQNALWFLICDADSGTQSLCRWDPALSAVSDDTIYTGTRYTAEAPDTDGLARMEAEAARIGEAYGVEILLWKDALSMAPSDYACSAEYLVDVYQRSLPQLEAALAKFPAGFLEETAKNTPSGKIQIALLRSMEGDPLYGTLDSVDSVQYWRNGEACVALALGGGLEQNLWHGLFHVIETRVYAAAVTYDDWEDLNPKGFRYDYDYIANLDRTDGQYLENASRAFIDTYSMSFPREDRARIFEYAMAEDRGDYFSSDTMQKKLKTLCTGIRKAYGLQKYEETLPWEQYLSEPLI